MQETAKYNRGKQKILPQRLADDANARPLILHTLTEVRHIKENFAKNWRANKDLRRFLDEAENYLGYALCELERIDDKTAYKKNPFYGEKEGLL